MQLGSGGHLEDGEISQMTLPSRHMIRGRERYISRHGSLVHMSVSPAR